MTSALSASCPPALAVKVCEGDELPVLSLLIFFGRFYRAVIADLMLLFVKTLYTILAAFKTLLLNSKNLVNGRR